MEQKPSESLELETGENSLESPPAEILPATENAPLNEQVHPKGPGLLQRLKEKINIYMLLFILLLVIAGIIVGAAYVASKRTSGISDIASQSISQNTFEQLANSDVSTIGNSDKVLNVQSSAVFAGKVLARQDFEVAGSLQLGGTLAIADLTSTGTAQLGQAQVNRNFSVAGNTSLQGAVTMAKSLQVNGSGSFSGPLSAAQISTSSLQLNGDLALTRHITLGGVNPGRVNGAALGGGGTSSVSGSDSGGTVTINTGSSAPPGCFITVNFTSRYNSVPRVLLTPVGAGAAGIDYYVNRTTSGFSICSASIPPSGASFGFDYFVAG